MFVAVLTMSSRLGTVAFGGVPSLSSKQSFRIPSSRAAHARRCAVMSFGKTMWRSSSTTTLEPQWKQLQAFYCSSQHWPETGNEFSNPLRGEVDLGVDGLNGATSPLVSPDEPPGSGPVWKRVGFERFAEKNKLQGELCIPQRASASSVLMRSPWSNFSASDRKHCLLNSSQS